MNVAHIFDITNPGTPSKAMKQAVRIHAQKHTNILCAACLSVAQIKVMEANSVWGDTKTVEQVVCPKCDVGE